MKKWLGICLFVALGAFPGLSMAQESSSTLDDVLVTATRNLSDAGKIGGISATVITAEDIDIKKLTSVEDVLKGIPGLDVASTGGGGSLTSVFLRGADSKNTLVLVDGVMLNDATSPNRNADLGNLTLDNIERIEVIRGPSSVLYGSNATGGVINIITKTGKETPSFYVGTEGGSYNTWKQYGGSSGKVGRVDYSLSASHLRTDGFSSSNADNPNIPHNGNTDEKDGWENTTLSGKVGVEITPDFDLSAVFRFIDSESEIDDWGAGYTGDRFDGAYPGTPTPDGATEKRNDSRQWVGKFTVHNFFMDRFFESNLSYQATDLDRTSFDNDGAQTGKYQGRTQDLSWQGSLNFTQSQLSFGTTWFQEEMESQSTWGGIPKADAHTLSFWLQEQLFLGDSWDVVAGVRYDDHDRFGGKATWRLAPAYTIQGTGTTLKASYGTGFRAPSLYELYSPTNGKSDLKPEKSKGWDAGIEQSLLSDTVTVGVTYFDMRYTDRIGYDFLLSKYNQLEGETLSHGVETFVRWMARHDLEFGLTYTYNDTKDPNGEKLTRRPENKFHLNSRYRPVEALQLNLDLFWVGVREAISSAKDVNGNAVDVLEKYTLVNFSAGYDLTENIQIYGRLDNLLDEDYEEAWSYATAGRSAYAGIKVSY
ncbi:MAG: TonB-dependent receptor [Desulfobacterales bacterium]|nr:TonB-dependent receptor [Desulfobacterales bacterium]